jgi:hypothetical protein
VPQLLAEARKKWASFLLLFVIINVHNSAHNAVMWRWNALEMYKVRTLPDVFIDADEPFDSPQLYAFDLLRFLSFLIVFLTGMHAVVSQRNGDQIVLATHRYILVYSAASVIRCITFFLTMLPATAPYCLAPELGGTYSPERAPKTVQEIFTRFDWTHGCGDLLYSGHVVLTTCAHMLTEELATRNVRFATRLFMLPFLYLTVRSRKHYSVDVFLAFCVTVLLWRAIHPVQRRNGTPRKMRKEAKFAKDNSPLPPLPPLPAEIV